jgi:hypothetical protein
MQHLLVDLKQVARRKQTMLENLQSGLVCLIQATKFQQLNDGHRMCFKCLHDFFSRSDAIQKNKSKKKLNLEFVT